MRLLMLRFPLLVVAKEITINEKVVSNGGIAINQRASSKFLERIFQHKNGKAIIPAHFILFFKVKTIGMDVTTIINCLVTKMIKSARFH